MKSRENPQTLPETEIYLFVGGPLDGDWREVRDKEEIALAARDDDPYAPAAYSRIDLVGDDDNPAVTMYAHSAIDGIGGLMAKLVDGHHNPKRN